MILGNVISIHALLAESDYILVNTFLAIFEFLSTLSLRRATLTVLNTDGQVSISIHALLAESDRAANCQQRNHQISIHALLAESDPLKLAQTSLIEYISIHALLAESDRLWIMLYSCPGNFYPRSPCGERRITTTIICTA